MVGGVDAMVVLVSALDSSQAYWAAATGIVGSVAGSLVLFYIARKGGEAYLLRYTASGRGAKLRAWFLEYGLLTVFVPAFVPVIPMPLKIFILSAGALGVRPLTFCLVLAGARICRYFFFRSPCPKVGQGALSYLLRPDL